MTAEIQVREHGNFCAYIVTSTKTGEPLAHYPYIQGNKQSQEYAFDHAVTFVKEFIK